MITALRLTFHNAGVVELYSASNPNYNLASKFSNGNTMLFHPVTGNQWLEITYYTGQQVIIQDYNTQTTINILADGVLYNVCVSNIIVINSIVI